VRQRTHTLLLVTVAVLISAAALPAPASEGAWLGIRMRSASSEHGGIEVDRVIVDSPAAQAGLRARDVIVAVDGQAISDPAELIRTIQDRAAGAWVPLSVRRGGDDLDLRVRLAPRPDNPERQAMREGWIGARAIDLPPALREHFGAPAAAGAMVFEVGEGSPAESAGLRLGDVVFEIEGQPVDSAAKLYAMLAGAGVGNSVELAVARDGAEILLEAVVEDVPPEIVERRRTNRR